MTLRSTMQIPQGVIRLGQYYPPRSEKKFEFNKYFIIHLKIFDKNADLDRCVTEHSCLQMIVSISLAHILQIAAEGPNVVVALTVDV